MLETETTQGVLVVRMTAKRLDATASPGFKTRMSELIGGGADRIVLDLAEVGFIDSSGLGTIVGCLKQLGTRGDLLLVGLQPPVVKLLQLTRLDRVFKSFASVDEAVGSFGPKAG